MRNVLIAQIFVLCTVTIVYAVAANAASASGAAFGSGIALVNGLLLFWRLKRADRLPPDDAGRHLRSVYASAIERFVMVVALFAIGFGSLQLQPLPMLIGFVAGQAALLLTGLTGRTS